MGQSLQLASSDMYLYINTSNMDWRASVLEDSVGSLWDPHECSLHINLLELKTIFLGLAHFKAYFHSKTVAMFFNNATALSYLAKEGSTHSRMLNVEAQGILQWAVQILTQFMKGSSNVLADCLSKQDQMFSTE